MEKNSENIISRDTSFTKPTQIYLAIQAAKNSTVIIRRICGTGCRYPHTKIKLKMFHSKIQNDYGAIAAEERQYIEIPILSVVSCQEIQEDDLIKSEVRHIVRTELNVIKAELKLYMTKMMSSTVIHRQIPCNLLGAQSTSSLGNVLV